MGIRRRSERQIKLPACAVSRHRGSAHRSWKRRRPDSPGTVIAVRTEEKEWEKERYTQTTVSISDGEQVYLLRHRHDSKTWIIPTLFQAIKVRVTRATTEKGQLTVGGTII